MNFNDKQNIAETSNKKEKIPEYATYIVYTHQSAGIYSFY